jgi:hypothetical protein
VGQLDDAGDQTPPAGVEDAVFGLAEPREIEVGELVEGALGLSEAALELAGGGAQWGDRGLTGLGHGAVRVTQERRVGDGVGTGTPRGEQGLGLARAKSVAHDGLGQALLLALGEARQGVSGGGGEPTLIDVPGQIRGQPAAEGEAAIDPAAAVAEQLGDLGGRQAVVVAHRADHAGLVHGAGGAPGGIGLEHAGLAHHPRGVFHDGGHVGAPLVDPARQPLEAVEHFVGAARGGGHAQGQRGEGAREIGAGAPQSPQGGRQLINGHVDDQTHGRRSGSGRSW